MTKIAIEKYGADIVFHCDADEFWLPKSGNLKNELIKDKADILTVNSVNVSLEDKNGNGLFPQDAKYAIIKPIETENFQEDSKKENLYFFRYPSKVMFKTKKGLLEVTQGNHSIVNPEKDLIQKKSSDITIFHFPLRGKARFYNKVIESGEAVERNVLLNKGISWHVRRWYEAYKNGTLDQEYKNLTIPKEKAEEMKKNGMIEEFNFIKFIED